MDGFAKLRRCCLAGGWVASALLVGCAAMNPMGSTDSQVVQPHVDDRQAHLVDEARERFDGGYYESSREVITQALKILPDDPAARIISAKLYLQAGELDAADRDLSIAIRSDPGSAEAEYLFGIVCQCEQDQQEALDHFAQASEKAPDDLVYLMARGQALAAVDRQSEALALLQGRLSDFPHSAAIRGAIGSMLIEQKQYNDAVNMLRSAAMLSPADLKIREHLIASLFYDRRYEECGNMLQPLLQEDGYHRRADLLLMLADCDLATNKLADARMNYELAIRIEPDADTGWLGLGKVCLSLGDLNGAEIAAGQALVVKPDDAQASLLLGYIRLRQARNSDALAAFQKANQLDPKDIVAICMIGVTEQKLGHSDLAHICYAKALTIKPSDEMASQLMARLDLHE